MSKPLISLWAALAILAGCGSVSPLGMIAAARLDPLETAPRDISVAAAVPDRLVLEDGDATLFLGFTPEDASLAAPIALTVPLRVTPTADGPRAPKAGEIIYVFGFSEAAAARMAQAQGRIKALRARDVAGLGTLSLSLNGGCLRAPLDQDFPAATWLRTSPQGRYVQLTRTADLRALAATEGAAAGDVPSWPPC